MKPAYLIENILWDTDQEEVDLPSSAVIELDDSTDEAEVQWLLSDSLSDRYGFCHYGFTYSLIED